VLLLNVEITQFCKKKKKKTCFTARSTRSSSDSLTKSNVNNIFIYSIIIKTKQYNTSTPPPPSNKTKLIVANQHRRTMDGKCTLAYVALIAATLADQPPLAGNWNGAPPSPYVAPIAADEPPADAPDDKVLLHCYHYYYICFTIIIVY
jgi:hypothetical protein